MNSDDDHSAYENITSQEEDDLRGDLAALYANLKRSKLSSFPDIDRKVRAIFRQWAADIEAELDARQAVRA